MMAGPVFHIVTLEEMIDKIAPITQLIGFSFDSMVTSSFLPYFSFFSY